MVATTKSQIAAHLQESEKRSQLLRDDKELALEKLQQLRAQVNKAGITAHTNLVTLTCQCSATLKVLQQLVEKVSWAVLGRDVPVPSVLLSFPPAFPGIPPRPSASCAWLRCAAGWRQRRRRCCPSTPPHWLRGSRRKPSRS